MTVDVICVDFKFWEIPGHPVNFPTRELGREWAVSFQEALDGSKFVGDLV